MVRLAVLTLLSRPDVSNLAVVAIGIRYASHVAVMSDLGFKGFDEALNDLVRVDVVR
ncbi:hypothetical protein D3C76_1827550 [compost metagenome]